MGWRWAQRLLSGGLLLANVHAQYDFPLDSCACHIFYEHWVQMQLVISRTFTEDFADKAMDETSGIREAITFDSCRDLQKEENSLGWTATTAAATDCAPGQMSTFIMCSQLALLRGDLEAALLWSDIANYMLPFAASCMDVVQWTISPEDFSASSGCTILVKANSVFKSFRVCPLKRRRCSTLV
ncbi:unnamed protein product [Symbiodinium microadriaticum]|nr:unnamed protein product [Symbiodinium sp. KB8]CAE7562738.1 unnamed protein product [Symbiodinium microadriaticum]